jgi:hypothetical protein
MDRSNLDILYQRHGTADDDGLAFVEWVEQAVRAAPNKALLQRQLDSLAGRELLLRFLHRFLLFNDALAARVPFLAGLIHLSPDLFVDPDAGVRFCGQRNGTVAAYVAQAAGDEYHMTPDGSMVHQHLSQEFFRGVMSYFDVDAAAFDDRNPIPKAVQDLLAEARGKFFDEPTAVRVFTGLGFHIGLEFFANEEFNLVDAHLRAKHPDLVGALEQRRGGQPLYLWLAVHTVVEIHHYRAGLEAVRSALRYYAHPAESPAMVANVKRGFGGFVDLQRRYYEAILADAK